MSDLAVLEHHQLDDLVARLVARGYQVIGPTVRDGVVRYETVTSASDLPRGYVDHQEGGAYRLVSTDSEAYFSVVHGPDAAKSHLFPPHETLFTVAIGPPARFAPAETEEAPLAFVGLRPCDVAAVAVHDRVLVDGPFVDPAYLRRRNNALIVAVNCTRSVSTCFCTSMNTGPRATSGFDLALTEVLAPQPHFLVEVGSDRGEELLADLSSRPASDTERRDGLNRVEACAEEMARRFDTSDIKELLYANLEHQQWESVAERCLACGNCTMVCPTCFCTTPVDASSLDGTTAERSRIWASCFSLDYSYMGGHPVRTSGASRYRQWMTHKLATWIDEFGSSGCVGCGRCITWCPVGIDLTQETNSIRANDMRISA